MKSFPEEAKTFWNQWQIRIMVILSLSFQTILTIFGSRRKFTANVWIQFLVWSSYLSADWVATAALGNLGSSDSTDPEDKSSKSNAELQAFWAPFLTIHLGGPDTITAFSLEDNELWLRHFLSFVVQVGVAIHVYVRFWRTNVLTYIATSIFIVGALKYVERVFVLYSSGKERLTKLSLPDFIRGLDRYKVWMEWEASPLVDVCFLLEKCARLSTGQFLDGEVQWFGHRILGERSGKDIFKITAFELGFMYDFLYTKAKMIYSGCGISARCFSLLSFVTAAVLFSIFIDIPAHPLADIIISYLLLIGAIFTDLYGFILHVFSDWTKLYLSKYRNGSLDDTLDATFFAHPLLGNHKKWCRSMGQLNLISYCIKDEITAASAAVGKLLSIVENLENQWYVTWADVSDDLEDLIYRELKEKVGKVDKQTYEPLCSTAEGQRIMAGRGDYVLEERYNTSWLITFTASKPYGYSLLAWHIATELCYREDLHKHCNGNPDTLHRCCKISKCLSDYMLYLLVVCPSLMPEETNLMETIYKHTCRDIIHHYYNQQRSLSEAWRCFPPPQMTAEELQEESQYVPSATMPGRWLGQQLQSLELKEDWNCDKKWEMISEVWVEILAYAASHSTWNEHSQHLRKGGELLTHVRLLMAHLGLSSQYLYANAPFFL